MLSSRIRHSKLLISLVVLLLSTLACVGFEKTHCTWWEGGEWISYESYPGYFGGCCKISENDCLTGGPPTPIYWDVAPPSEESPTETNPSQVEPSPTSEDPLTITGAWHGTAQWICDNNIWETRLEFRSNGSVGAALSTATDYVDADGTWVLKGNEISLQFQYGLWLGTVLGNTMQGTFTDNDCNGIWTVTKE